MRTAAQYGRNHLAPATALLLSLTALGLLGCSRSSDGQLQGEAEWHGIGQCYEFADKYWSLDRYVKWLKDSLGIAWDNQPYWDGKDSVYLPHQIPHTKTTDYYKMIGNYDQFRWGWADYDPETEYSCHRALYIDCLRGIGFPAEHAPVGP